MIPSGAAINTPAAATAADDSSRPSLDPAAETTPPSATTTAASGTYMRRSAPTSVKTGTTLDVGASAIRNHAPRKPTTLDRRQATTMRTTITSIAATPGHDDDSGTGEAAP